MCTSIPGPDGGPIHLKWHSIRRLARVAATIHENLVTGLEAGAVMEVDIRLTADGRWVCLHDRSIRDETSGTGSLDERTADQLTLLRLRTPSDRVTDHPVLFLDDVLAELRRHAANEAEVQFDLKEPADRISDNVLERFADDISPLAEHFALSRSELAGLERLRSAVSELPVTSSSSAQLRGASTAEEFAPRFDTALDALDGLAMV
jgi:glycerophosphoryl diester phosphodiesterase